MQKRDTIIQRKEKNMTITDDSIAKKILFAVIALQSLNQQLISLSEEKDRRHFSKLKMTLEESIATCAALLKHTQNTKFS